MPDPIPPQGSSTGGHQAPRGLGAKVVYVVGLLVVAAAVGLVMVAVTGRIPAGTDTGALAVRAAIGLSIGILLFVAVRRILGSLTEPPPPPPPTVDAAEVDVVYVCIVCGTRLRLEVAATGKAPRHCGETMESEVAPGR